MTTLRDVITERFLVRLEASTTFDAEKVLKLRELLASGKSIKAEQLVAIMSLPPAEELR